MVVKSRKGIGLIMIVVALSGLIFDLFALYSLFAKREFFVQTLQANLSLAEAIVQTSNEMVTLSDQVLITTTAELTHLEESLLTMTALLQDVDPLLTSLQELTGENLPETLAATQNSLATAQQSADIVDTVLRAVTAIPFFPGEPYDPQIPLSDSLGQISESLSTIPPVLGAITSELESAQTNLTNLDRDLANIVSTTRQAQTDLNATQSVLNQYLNHLDEAQKKIDAAQKAAPTWINQITWVLVFVLSWLGLMQIGLLLQGLSLISFSER